MAKGDKQRHTPESFWRLIAIGSPDECWEWQGRRTPSGYGQVSWNNRHRVAHRIAYMLVKGEIPDGLEVMHLCNNKPCCNPSHLQIGTHAENMRMTQRVLCKRGHAQVPSNMYYAKDGSRQCNLCSKVRRLERYQRERAALERRQP